MNNVDELISWFSGRALPTGAFRISGWEWTSDLAHAVELATANARRNNPTSIDLLRRIKVKLEVV